jgi:hypothetical protein
MYCMKCVILMIILAESCAASSTASAAQKAQTKAAYPSDGAHVRALDFDGHRSHDRHSVDRVLRASVRDLRAGAPSSGRGSFCWQRRGAAPDELPRRLSHAAAFDDACFLLIGLRSLASIEVFDSCLRFSRVTCSAGFVFAQSLIARVP